MPLASKLEKRKFGNLKVICRNGSQLGKALWSCKCKCGGYTNCTTGNLISGKSTTCGKCYYNFDFTNQKFGKLTAIKKGESNKVGATRWVFKCDCGKEILTTVSSVLRKYNNTKSCGCQKYTSVNKKYKDCEDLSGFYFNSLRKSAKARNFPFEISIEEAWDLFIKQGKKCALSGWNIEMIKNYPKTKFQTASFDRIDSKKGYIHGNVQWVHKDINLLKMAYSEEYLFKMCKAIVDNKELK